MYCTPNRGMVEDAKLMIAMDFWSEYRNSRV